MEPAPAAVIAEWERERQEFWEQIRAANADIAERSMRLGGAVWYDRDDDWLVLTLGEPTEAATYELDDFLRLRYDPETLKIVGLEVTPLADVVVGRPDMRRLLEPYVALASTLPSGTYGALPFGALADRAAGLRALVLA